MFVVLGLIVAPAGSPAWGDPYQDPNKVAIPDDPALPNVLIIGDSVSQGYTPRVKELLKGKANVFHIEDNARSSGSAVGWAMWAAKPGKKWDVILFNYGIWDVSHDWRVDNNGRKIAGTTPEEYENNLRAATTIFKATGAKIIFATTTPVGPSKATWDSVPERNKIAVKIMQENGIAIDDLYSIMASDQAGLRAADDIHQNEKGNEVLARSVAASIEMQISKGGPG